MKNQLIKLLCCFICFTTVSVVQAQVKFGLRGGLSTTEFNLKQLSIKDNPKLGWYVGPTLSVKVPLLGLGVNASVLYNQAKGEIIELNRKRTIKYHALICPINLIYQVPLPVVTPFIFLGPEFNYNFDSSFPFSAGIREQIQTLGNFKDSNWHTLMNIGLGVTLLRKLEITAGYNFAFKSDRKYYNIPHSQWRFGAAVYF